MVLSHLVNLWHPFDDEVQQFPDVCGGVIAHAGALHPLTVSGHPYQARLPQYPQMPRDPGLGDASCFGQLADTGRPHLQTLEDAEAVDISHCLQKLSRLFG